MWALRDAIIEKKVQEMEEELIKIPEFIPVEFRSSIRNFMKKRREWLIKEGKYSEFCEMDHEWKHEIHRMNIRGEELKVFLFEAYIMQDFLNKYPQFKACIDTEVLHELISELELMLKRTNMWEQ